MFKVIFDYHTHTVFSHGKGTIEDNVKVALDKGLEGIAISDHGPGHLTYGIKRSAVPEMRKEIQRLREKYSGIEIYLSVEANTIWGGNFLDIGREETKEYDFVIAGYHYGVRKGFCISNWLSAHGIRGSKRRQGKAKERNTEMVVQAIERNHIKILTHPGDKADFDIEKIADACARNDVLMEISTHHPHLTVEEIKASAKYDVKFIISSDAHVPQRVGDFEGGLARAKEAGLDLSRIVNIVEI